MQTKMLAFFIIAQLAACTVSPVATSMPAATSTMTLVSVMPSVTASSTPSPTFSPIATSTAMPTAISTSTPIPTATPRPKTGAADQWLGAGNEREKLFDEYVQAIRDGQVFSGLGFKRLGTTWDKEMERTKKRFLEADTQVDVYYALLSLQRTIHDAHSSLTAPSALMPAPATQSLPFTLGIRGNSLESACYVVTQSAVPEIKPGFVLKQYNTQTPAQLEYAMLEWLNDSSPEDLKLETASTLTRYASSNRYPPPNLNAPVNVTFIDPSNQKEISATIRWQPGVPNIPSQDYDGFSRDYTGINYRIYKDTANSTLILVYSSFNYALRDADLKNVLARVSYSVPAFDRTQPLEAQSDWRVNFLQANQHPNIQAIKNYPFNAQLEEIDTLMLGRYLAQQSFANLLIDVRDNGGGNVPTTLLALIARERFQVLTRELVYVPLLRRDSVFQQEVLSWTDNYMRKIINDQLVREPNVPQSQRFPFDCRTSNCNLEETRFEPNASIKKYNVAILSGPGCMSACDQFVSIFKDNRMGQVVGLPSRGAHSPMRAKKELSLKNGDKFSLIFTVGIGYRANGEPLEGNPAPVDYYLFPEEDYVGKMVQYLKTRSFFK